LYQTGAWANVADELTFFDELLKLLCHVPSKAGGFGEGKERKLLMVGAIGFEITYKRIFKHLRGARMALKSMESVGSNTSGSQMDHRLKEGISTT
jgi:hypothetical protein